MIANRGARPAKVSFRGVYRAVLRARVDGEEAFTVQLDVCVDFRFDVCVVRTLCGRLVLDWYLRLFVTRAFRWDGKVLPRFFPDYEVWVSGRIYYFMVPYPPSIADRFLRLLRFFKGI